MEESFVMEIYKKPDWNELWKRQMLASRKSRNDMDCAQHWDNEDSARRFDERAKADGRKKAIDTIKGLPVHAGSRVLDIGAGPGTHTIPLAHIASHVTAVEPSSAMMSCLNSNLAEEGLDNVLCVREKWEDVDVKNDLVPPYDIVIASFSLGMADIAGAIEKMNEACSGHVYLYWFAGVPYWEKVYSELWEELHGCSFIGRPRIDYIFNLLYDMGIYANVSVYPEEYCYCYSSLDEAVGDLSTGYNVRDDRQRNILRDYLGQKLEKKEEGLTMKGQSYYARIWWKV